MLSRLQTFGVTLALMTLALVCGLVGYQMLVSHIATDLYRDRLVELGGDYDRLRGLYNQAVRKTAVTELHVAEGQVSVLIRRIDGQEQVVPTPFDPASEIYIDYVVLDGRLWIRRVFDEHTPANRAVVVDPRLVEVDWNAAGARHGKAAYRQFSPGRWVVTVTGDGSIGLEKLPDDAVVDLVTAPELREFAPMEEQTRAAVDRIGLLDVARRLVIGQEAAVEELRASAP